MGLTRESYCEEVEKIPKLKPMNMGMFGIRLTPGRMRSLGIGCLIQIQCVRHIDTHIEENEGKG